MLDLIVLSGFSFALYRLAAGYNINPWKWIVRYVTTFMVSSFAMGAILIGVYGPNIMKDTPALVKMSLMIEPFVLLYQFVLFFFFRTRMVKYVHALDQLDKINDTPTPPSAPKKDDQDFSYFR